MLYRHMEQGQVLNDMAFLMENYDNEYYNKEDLRGLLFDSVNEILELAVSHGLTGNLWHDYLTFLLASDENAYSTSCEIVGAIDGSMNQVAMHDFAIFKELYDYDFTELEKALGVDCMSMLKGFEAEKLEYVVKALSKWHWSPEQIAGRWRKEHFLCGTTPAVAKGLQRKCQRTAPIFLSPRL